jgi:hypothetical protein
VIVLRCNGCGAASDDKSSPWFSLERTGLSYGQVVQAISDDPGPWHFCTVYCMADWARGRAGTRPSHPAGRSPAESTGPGPPSGAL